MLARELVGSRARNFGVAATLDIGRISGRGSVKARSSIYRRHQRSARTKISTLSLGTGTVVERNLVGDGGTVLADSDGLAIAPQDTIHLPDHGTSSKCIFKCRVSYPDNASSALQFSFDVVRELLLDHPATTSRAVCHCPHSSNVSRHGV